MPASLVLVADPQDDARLILDWLRRAAEESWKQEAPTVLLAPTPARINFCRQLALEAGLTLLNVRFWTPPEARRHLLKVLLPQISLVSSPDMELLAAAAANGPQESSLLSARFLQAMELAGWDLLPQVPGMSGCASRLATGLKRAGLTMSHEADRELGAAARPGLLNSLLIAGFHGAHWPLLRLLQACARAADALTVHLIKPREAAFDLDSVWISTWEASAAQRSREGALLPTEAIPSREKPADDPEYDALVARDLAGEAEMAAALAARWLASCNHANVALCVPSQSALSREIAAALDALGLPYFDALGSQAWNHDHVLRSWIDFERNRSLDGLLALFEARNEDPSRAMRWMDDARASIGSSNWKAILAWIQKSHGNEAARQLLPFEPLPESATIAEYAKRTCQSLHHLSLRLEEARTASLAERLPADSTVIREAWLVWVASSLEDRQIMRSDLGKHRFARIHLLRLDQAEGQNWTHLLLCGMHQGAWPRSSSLSIDSEQIETWNARIRAANRASKESGPHGEGQEVASEPLRIGPDEDRRLANAVFEGLQATHRLAISYSRLNLDGKEQHGSPFFHEIAGRMAAATDRHAAIHQAAPIASKLFRRSGRRFFPEIAEARTARTNRDSPFGPYDFAGEPGTIGSIPVRSWEEAFRSPAQVWMRRVLRIEPLALERGIPFERMLGTLVHQWLAGVIPSGGAPLPTAEAASQRIEASLQTTRTGLEAFFSDCGMKAPPWMPSILEEACGAARELYEAVAGEFAGKPAVTEHRLEPTTISAPSGAAFETHGKADLIIVHTGHSLDDPSASLVVLDYKTGAAKPASASDLAKAAALQPALYAWALERSGLNVVLAGYVTRSARDLWRQIDAQTRTDAELLLEIPAKISETGVFGMRGPLRPERGYSADLPLATLTVRKTTLEERWRLTHGNAA